MGTTLAFGMSDPPGVFPVKEDVFPVTMNTWIRTRLDDGDGGRKDVNRHVMSVHLMPLRTYSLGTNERWLGEPEEVVQGFFADRLARGDFFSEWERSGMRLRRWLVNAFCFYLKELRRRKFRDGRAGDLADDPVTFSGDPEREVDRAFVVSVVQQALELGKKTCEDAGLGEHWGVFEQHYCRQMSYAEIADETGLKTDRAAVMARTAARKFRAALRELLERDAMHGDVDSEIAALLEICDDL